MNFNLFLSFWERKYVGFICLFLSFGRPENNILNIYLYTYIYRTHNSIVFNLYYLIYTNKILIKIRKKCTHLYLPKLNKNIKSWSSDFFEKLPKMKTYNFMSTPDKESFMYKYIGSININIYIYIWINNKWLCCWIGSCMCSVWVKMYLALCMQIQMQMQMQMQAEESKV